MGDQKWKSIEFEKEFVEISDRNGDDTGHESLPGFFVLESPVFEPSARRYVTKASLNKGKSNMHVPEKLLVKRKQIISVQKNSPYFPTSTTLVQNQIVQSFISEVHTSTLITKSAHPQGWTTQFQFVKAPKKKITSSIREDCLGRKFHEKCYNDFKAFVASSLTQFSMDLCC